MTDTIDLVTQYLAAGWALAPIKPGTKQPRGVGWQSSGAEASHWDARPDDGAGIIHQHSGTCAIDIDDMECARLALEAIGIGLDDLLADGVQIVSREGRGKLLYRAPAGLPATRHALNWPARDGSGHFCVIEFRAGLVQDVLPPSIHPDTGRPYEWRGDWRNLLPLPEPLAAVWREWDLARIALRDACPWAMGEKPPAAPRRSYSKGSGVIDAFNAAHDPGLILEAHGYRRCGRRWLSPHSSTKIPGVVRMPESDPPTIYVHHASDPLCDEHAHDAFSLYCQLDHGGDVTAAVRQAAELLGIVRPEDREAAVIADRITSAARERHMATVTPIPPPKRREPETALAPNPGEIPVPQVREVEEIVRSSLHAVKPDSVRQAVLSLACAMTARRYETYHGHPTTTFFGITDSSVAGLRPLKGELYGIAKALGERKALRGTKIPSSGVLYQALLRCARMYWVTDEYGHIVQMARRQQSGALESAIAVLHECYTGQTLYIDPDTATTGKPRSADECDIYSPCITMLAMLANDQLAALGQRSEYGRGTLQQTLIIPAGDQDEHHDPGDLVIVTPQLIEHAKRILSTPGIPGAEQSPTQQPILTRVPLGDGARLEIDESRARMLAYMALSDERAQWRGMVHGYTQSAIRVGSALAAWESPGTPVLSAALAGWACQWAERCLMLTVPRLEVTVSETDEPDAMQRVQQALYEAREPLTAREIARRCRMFRRLSAADRDELLTRMADDGVLIAQPSQRSVKYVAPVCGA